MLYDNVKSIAKQKGIPIYKIEEELQIARGSICKWNAVTPGIDKVCGVAKILKVPIDKLVGKS